MAYYNYHAKIKNKIKDGKLSYYYFDDEYKNIGFALVLCFNNEKYPIREKRFTEYFDLIGSLYFTKVSENFYYTYFKQK